MVIVKMNLEMEKKLEYGEVVKKYLLLHMILLFQGSKHLIVILLDYGKLIQVKNLILMNLIEVNIKVLLKVKIKLVIFLLFYILMILP